MDEKVQDISTMRDDVSENWLKLPSAPVFMCIMKTEDGKPVGFPLWKSFDNKADELNLNNETLSSTFLSLSKNLRTLNPDYTDETDTVLRITYNQRSWSVYIPAKNAEFQISFFVAFEETDQVKITDEDRSKLTKTIVENLKKIPELGKISKNELLIETIEKNTKLYSNILEVVSKAIQIWDKKRIKYLQLQAEIERQRIIEENKALQKEINQEESQQE
jgi:hypothetical protein